MKSTLTCSQTWPTESDHFTAMQHEPENEVVISLDQIADQSTVRFLFKVVLPHKISWLLFNAIWIGPAAAVVFIQKTDDVLHPIIIDFTWWAKVVGMVFAFFVILLACIFILGELLQIPVTISRIVSLFVEAGESGEKSTRFLRSSAINYNHFEVIEITYFSNSF